jgi:hypothetical protein
MKVILAREEMRILGVALCLNSGMIYLIFSAAEISGGIERFEGLGRDKVAT